MSSSSGKTIRLTVAQAVVKYISAQYSVADGERQRFVPAAFGIFGHGNVAGLGQALDEYNDDLPFIQGRNEQALAHAAIAFAKASRRRQTLAVTASIGPGALNMVTAAGLATVNRLPVLLLPGDDLEHIANKIRSLRIFTLLNGARGLPKADIDEIATVVQKFIRLGISLSGRVSEMEVNPLVVDGRTIVAVDCLVILN